MNWFTPPQALSMSSRKTHRTLDPLCAHLGNHGLRLLLHQIVATVSHNGFQLAQNREFVLHATVTDCMVFINENTLLLLHKLTFSRLLVSTCTTICRNKAVFCCVQSQHTDVHAGRTGLNYFPLFPPPTFARAHGRIIRAI